MNGRELYLFIYKKQPKTKPLSEHFVSFTVKFGGGIKGYIEDLRKLIG
jgi:hypothetical protein